MILDLSKTKIFIRPGITDMRKAIRGLSVLVQDEMELDPFSGQLYLFCNRAKKIMKALYWDRNGFCLWQKRLEKHRFPWPETEERVREMTKEDLELVLDGIDIFSRHTALSYKKVG